MAWTIKKWLVSAFVVAHVLALTLWNLPSCAIRDRLSPWISYYVLPLGLWQSWGMFAPEPPKDSTFLEAITRDSHGVVRGFAFPKLAGMTPWRSYFWFRHAKFGSTAGMKDQKPLREFAARHVLRSLDLPADAYPVDLQLVYRVRSNPPPGAPAAEIPLIPQTMLLDSYWFPSRKEVEP